MKRSDMSKQVKISSIKVGERRRERLGDIKGLAKSIEKYGLLHPIVVDERLSLVAGERRLRACEFLGRKHIEAKQLGELSESELRELELEENTRRKGLTREEKTRQMIRYAEAAAAVIEEEKKIDSNDDFLSESDKKPNGRPKSEGATQQEIADHMGVSRTTLSRAEAFAQALDKYPELKNIGGEEDDVIRMARNLDKASEDDRKKFLNLLKLGDTDTITDLADKPRMPKADPEEEKRRKGEEKWLELLYEFSRRINSINALGGMAMLTDQWSQAGRKNALTAIRGTQTELEVWQHELEGAIDEERTLV